MNSWPLMLLLICILYFCWTAFSSVLLNKEVLIKRINPTLFCLVGDLTYNGSIFRIRFKWRPREFSLHQISKITAYSLTDWGLSEYEHIDIWFAEKYKIRLDGSLEEHQEFTKFLLLQLGVDNKVLDWGFLPQLNDKMRRDIVFVKNNIR